MVTSNILQRTFLVRFNGYTGTAFTVDIGGRQYILTAKHVIEGINPIGTLEISHENIWENCQINDVWYSPNSDVALISPAVQLSPTYSIKVAKNTEYYISQQVYFLGFPFGWHTDVGQVNNGYPLPFVKSAIISSFINAEEGSATIILDGNNNPGFSGGPIITVSVDNSISVIGVISAYRNNQESILANGVDSGLRYSANTGLIIGIGLNEVIATAEAKNSGAVITS